VAKETITKLIDDIDGGVAHETVQFALDGRSYEIDLSSKNAKRLRAELAAYVESGTRVSRRVAGSGGRTLLARGHSPIAVDKDQNRAVREWAQRKGFEVAARGRIRQEIIDEYQKLPVADVVNSLIARTVRMTSRRSL
jgi:hypothetical protein